MSITKRCLGVIFFCSEAIDLEIAVIKNADVSHALRDHVHKGCFLKVFLKHIHTFYEAVACYLNFYFLENFKWKYLKLRKGNQQIDIFHDYDQEFYKYFEKSIDEILQIFGGFLNPRQQIVVNEAKIF